MFGLLWFITFILFIAKFIFGADIPWMVVFSPLWGGAVLVVFLFVSAGLLDNADHYFQDRNRRNKKVKAFTGQLKKLIYEHGPNSKEVIMFMDQNEIFRKEAERVVRQARG